MSEDAHITDQMQPCCECKARRTMNGFLCHVGRARRYYQSNQSTAVNIPTRGMWFVSSRVVKREVKP